MLWGDRGRWAGGHLDSQASRTAPALRNPGPGLLPREPEGGSAGCTAAAPGAARVSPGRPGPDHWGPVLGVGVLLFFEEKQFSKWAKTCFKKS